MVGKSSTPIKVISNLSEDQAGYFRAVLHWGIVSPLLFTIGVGFLVLAFDFLVLRQYRSLDHPARFSIGGESNIPVDPVSLLPL